MPSDCKMSKNRRRIPIPEPEPEIAIEGTPEEEVVEAVETGNETEDEAALSDPPLSFAGRIKKAVSALPSDKPRRITGFLCLFVGLFLALSFISHLFVWWKDYDGIQQLLTDGPFRDSGLELYNRGGRLGAWLAFFFINRGFGIASLLVPFMMIAVSLQLLNLKKFHWLGLLLRSCFFLIWVSLFTGALFTSGRLYIVGGSAGLHGSLYLQKLLGPWGLRMLLLFALICYLIINYNFRRLHFSLRKKSASTPSQTPSYSHPEEKPIAIIPQRPEDPDTDGMTLSLRIRMPEKNTSVVPPSSDLPAETPNVWETQPETENEPVSETKKEEEAQEDTVSIETTETTDTEGDDEMKIIDTRTVPDNKSEFLPPVPTHFGIETPFDPRMELSQYRMPGLDLLADFGDQSQKIQDMNEELLANKKKIVDTLQNYGIGISKISATIGPTVTLYEIVPAPGIRISKIKNLEDDIALSLSALGIRIIAPIPGKGTIGIEVPNSKKQIVPMRDMITCEKFRNKDFALPIALGKTISNEEYVTDLAKMPHLLVAGATGQGKSVGLNAIIASLLYSKHPAELKFVMVDPKKVELSLFNRIERHYLAKLSDCEDEAPVITDTRKVVRTLNSLCIEMDNRYDLLKEAGARNIKEYNQKFIGRRLNPENGHRFLPYIVLIIDEFADLIMTAGREVEQPIARLAQLARAIGIHLVIATQRPSVNIITGLIKANFPARIAFKVSQKIDSRTILDAGGADQLIGRGDMLISVGDGLTRLQCPFIDTPEIEKITEFISEQHGFASAYLLPECPDENEDGGHGDIGSEEWDPVFGDAARLVVSSQQGSTSMLQRKFKLGYNRAGRVMDQLENAGIVGGFEGGKKIRDVKIKDPQALEDLLTAIFSNRS